MPTWKKVVISGSAVSQLSNDANYLIAQQDGAILSGSFSGSFVGDGSNLSGIATSLVVSGSTGNDSLNLKTEALTISGDGQGITTSVDSGTNTISLVSNGLVSSSTQIQDLGFASDAELNASSSTLQSNIDGIDSRVTDLEAFSSSLDSAFATEAELYAATASLSSSAEAARVSLESSLTADLNASSSTLQGNIDSAITTANSELNASSSTLQGNIDSAISTANAELNASSSTLQSNIDTKASITELNTSSSILQSNIDDVAADVAALGDTYATDAELNASSSTLQGNIDSAITTANSELNASSSTLQSNIDGVETKADTAQAGVNGLNTYSSSLKDAITVSGQNVTIAGDFTVSGTTTTVNSTTVEIDDNIIALNGTGATNAGLLVNDPNGPASGSFIWKGDQNAWFAGGEGSEVKVLLATGDNVVSGSQQIQDLGFASDAELNASSSTLQSNIDGVATAATSALNSSSSILQSNIDSAITTANTELNASSSTLQSNIDTVAADVAALGDTYATDVELNASSSTLQGNIDSAISTANSELNASSSVLQGNIDTAISTANSELNASSSTLQSNIDTKANITELNASSSTLQSNIDGVDSRVTDLETFSSSLDASFASEAELNASASTLQGNIDTLETNTTAALNASSSALTSAYQSADTAISTSLAAGIATEKARIDAILTGSQADKDSFAEIVTLINSVDTENDNAFAAHYTSSNSRLDSLESFSSSLDSTFTTDAELNASSSTLQGNIDSAITTANSELNASSSTLQGNIDTKAAITQLNASSSTLQGNIDSAISTANTELNASSSTLQGNIDSAVSTANSELNASSSTLQGNIDTVDTKVGALETFSSSLDSIFATEAEMNATSASVKTYADNLVTNLSQTVAVSGSTGNDSIDLKTEALSIVGDGAGITTSVAANTVTITANGLVSASLEGDAQGQIKLNGSNVDINGLGSNDSPTFQDITVNGNLTTLGTVTNVNTTDLNIEDKFVLLNSGSATGNSGLIVQNSATVGQGTALFFDDSASRWALDHSGADAIADTATADAYVAAVVTSDDANYQKDGNIRIDSVTGEAYIFVS